MQVTQEPKAMGMEDEVQRVDATLDEIFNKGFMNQHTDVNNIGEFFVSGGFLPEDMQEICALPREELDAYVRQHTDFESWDQMLNIAVDELLTQMGYI